MSDSPISKERIIERLKELDCYYDIMEPRLICGKLKTLSTKTLRLRANEGLLAPMNPQNRKWLYTKEALVDFLFRCPAYVAAGRDREYYEITEDITKQIYYIIRKNWSGFLKDYEFQDLVSEVQVRLIKTKKTNCSECTAINSIISKIYREQKRSVPTLSLDEINQEQDKI